jgi:hypothetical protein
VIIATPLEVAGITFEGLEKQRWQEREYQKIYIRVMKGTVKPRYFNLNSSTKLPSIILTSKDLDPITRFAVNASTKNESWVTITSTEPVRNELLDDMFKNGKIVLDHIWNAAYPVFKPIERIPYSCLDKGLFYVNAIESAASSMESSTFAALNSINMIKQQITF